MERPSATASGACGLPDDHVATPPAPLAASAAAAAAAAATAVAAGTAAPELAPTLVSSRKVRATLSPVRFVRLRRAPLVASASTSPARVSQRSLLLAQCARIQSASYSFSILKGLTGPPCDSSSTHTSGSEGLRSTPAPLPLLSSGHDVGIPGDITGGPDFGSPTLARAVVCGERVAVPLVASPSAPNRARSAPPPMSALIGAEAASSSSRNNAASSELSSLPPQQAIEVTV